MHKSASQSASVGRIFLCCTDLKPRVAWQARAIWIDLRAQIGLAQFAAIRDLWPHGAIHMERIRDVHIIEVAEPAHRLDG